VISLSVAQSFRRPNVSRPFSTRLYGDDAHGIMYVFQMFVIGRINWYNLGLLMMGIFFPEGTCLLDYIISLLSPVFTSFEVVLAIRTWAVWRTNKFIGIGLAVMTLLDLVLQCIVLNKYVGSYGCTFIPLAPLDNIIYSHYFLCRCAASISRIQRVRHR